MKDEKNSKKLENTESKKSPVAVREEEILDVWDKQGTFQKSLEKTEGGEEYVFYDGPPFATGLPHYGSILPSVIKDTIPRFHTMRGKHVRRVWGWDCHGLPIENIVEKELGISGKKDIEKMGVEKFNEHARSSVLGFADEWEKTIRRIGRWVDFTGSYKTMDNTFIESVWWALGEIHKKGLLYEGTKVLPYCPRCETPIANAEIQMDNSYKDISDISVYVKFELTDEPGTYLLAWTTTPWTLPGNTALAVGRDFEYVKIKNGDGTKCVVAKELMTRLGIEGEVEETFLGRELEGKKYRPIFDYYHDQNEIENHENGWKVYGADFVTTEDGTGIVHIAPVFGEDDMALAKEHSLPLVYHVDGTGKFQDEFGDPEKGFTFFGLSAKPKGDHKSADIEILKYLQDRGVLFKKETIKHSYPHCFRCETPLYYYALPAWFINIQKVKPKILELNQKINWIPEHLKNGRFHKSAENAPDWNISRNRFWASPLPIWKNEKTGEPVLIGSLDELKAHTKKSGNTYVAMRHGEADSNVLDVVSSLPDNPHHLTEKGKSQAHTAGAQLKERNIDIIIASHFIRARETAEIVADEIGVAPSDIIYDARLGEINTGDYNLKPIPEYHKFFNSLEEKLTKTPPNGENIQDVKNRVTPLLYELEEKYKGKTILIVSHEYTNWMLFSGAFGWSGLQSVEEYKKVEKDHHFISNAEVRDLDFVPLPHNARFELDLHRPYIDNVPVVDADGTPLKRIPEVFDCWFESGSMPYGQFHYPFENKEEFKKNFPADFVTEYIAQTRTWFYYMLAVSTMLFDEVTFKNVHTTGTIQAEDGQKMSKSKNNFPDPQRLLDTYGSDALRMYLFSSPLMKAEDLWFTEKGVDEMYKKMVLRLRNVVSFYEMYSAEKVEDDGKQSTHILDRWIITRLKETHADVTHATDKYELDRAVRPLVSFVDDLSTWYLRRSRDRFKGEGQDQSDALATLKYVALEFSKTLAPFMPFLAEDVYQKVRPAGGAESVHLEDWSEVNELSSDESEILTTMLETRRVVSLGLEARAQEKVKVRQPLAELTVQDKNSSLIDKEEYLELIRDEVNVKKVSFKGNDIGGVTLDFELTSELVEEGALRELVRYIQEARKNANMDPNDKAVLQILGGEKEKDFVDRFEKEITEGASLSAVNFSQNLDDTNAITINELKFTIQVST